jgi:hypothetical protein
VRSGLAREAVALASATDCLVARGRAVADLAVVLEAAGDTAGAVRALDEAETLYERKGYVVGVGRIRERKSALSARR